MTGSVGRTALGKLGITGFCCHDLWHAWASWHREAGTSSDESKDIWGGNSRVMVDCNAKFAIENRVATVARIEACRRRNVPKRVTLRQ